MLLAIGTEDVPTDSSRQPRSHAAATPPRTKMALVPTGQRTAAQTPPRGLLQGRRQQEAARPWKPALHLCSHRYTRPSCWCISHCLHSQPAQYTAARLTQDHLASRLDTLRHIFAAQSLHTTQHQRNFPATDGLLLAQVPGAASPITPLTADAAAPDVQAADGPPRRRRRAGRLLRYAAAPGQGK